MKVFTKGVLESVNRMALVMRYNRAAAPEFLEKLPDDKFYTPKFELPHEHRAGQPCEPHMRCVFEHEGEYFIIDVEMGCYDLVPDHATVMETIRNATQEEPAVAAE